MLERCEFAVEGDDARGGGGEGGVVSVEAVLAVVVCGFADGAEVRYGFWCGGGEFLGGEGGGGEEAALAAEGYAA